MSETKDTTDKTLRTGQLRKPLTLGRTVESGLVQQKFSHGRSKSVVVEVKRKRTLTGGEPEEAAPQPQGQTPKVAQQRPQPGKGQSEGQAGAAPGQPPRILSEAERALRESVLQKQREREEQEKVAKLERARQIEADGGAAEDQVTSQTTADQALADDTAASGEHAPTAGEQGGTSATAEVDPAHAVIANGAEPAVEGTTAPHTAAPASPQAADVAAPAIPTATAIGPGTTPATPATRPTMTRPAPRPGATPARPQSGANTGYRSASAGVQSRVPPRVTATSTDPVVKSVGMTRPMIVSRTDRPSPKPPEAIKKIEDVAQQAKRPLRPATAATTEVADDEESKAKKRGLGGKVVRAPVGKADEGRVRGKLTITNAFDESQRQRSLASLKRRRDREKAKAMGVQQPRDKIMREVIIPEAITIQELANRMAERAVDVIKLLMKQGAMHTINDVIDADTAELIVTEFGHTAKRVSEADVEEGFIGENDADEHQEARAPVVTIMGHVDHGKTSLLDAIRKAKVAAGEAGGITQHIGAYQVVTDSGHKITFIDTPGHEAFTAMRARGAQVTDIVVLVVAADDGVMPQTIEAINHAKAAKVPIIVAINKMDKHTADPNRVRTELLQHEIVVESMSGDVLDVPVSAITGAGLDKLLEAIVLQSEILELKANPNRTANGFVIEAKLDRGRGPVGTLLVHRGSLHVGDIVVAGSTWGRVRALIDDKGHNVKEAGPSVPVEVLGFDGAPDAGDEFSVVENEARAREITDYRIRKRRETLGSAGTPRTLEGMMQQLKDADRKEFPLVIKGDVQGSVEAIIGSLKKISTEEVLARLIHTGVGGITESDVALANASKAIVIGFNTRANVQAKQLADSLGLEIRYYNIIYDLVDEVKAAMSGLLAPTRKEVQLGHAKIQQVFNISKVGKIAGCLVTDGKMERGAKLRLIRDDVVILQEGRLSTVKRFKDEVKEVTSGQECGMAFENFQDLRENDVIECYQVEIIKRTL